MPMRGRWVWATTLPGGESPLPGVQRASLPPPPPPEAVEIPPGGGIFIAVVQELLRTSEAARNKPGDSILSTSEPYRSSPEAQLKSNLEAV